MNYKEIASICEKHNIKNWTIDNNGLVDVGWHVNLEYKKLTKLPLQFGKVSGYFNCSTNQLISLEGAPKYVGNSFFSSNNPIKTLKGAPDYVGGNFSCSSNQLTTLKYAYNHSECKLYCTNNNIYDVYDIQGTFNIYSNPVYYIYKYITKDNKLVVSIDYFKDCKIQLGKDIYIERFMTFLDSYGLNNNINIDDLRWVGYNIK